MAGCAPPPSAPTTGSSRRAVWSSAWRPPRRAAPVVLAAVAGLGRGASMAAGEYVSVSSQADTERADLVWSAGNSTPRRRPNGPSWRESTWPAASAVISRSRSPINSWPTTPSGPMPGTSSASTTDAGTADPGRAASGACFAPGPRRPRCSGAPARGRPDAGRRRRTWPSSSPRSARLASAAPRSPAGPCASRSGARWPWGARRRSGVSSARSSSLTGDWSPLEPGEAPCPTRGASGRNERT